MKISQEFQVARPLPVVWDFFHDIPRVAACLPGAEYLGPVGEGKHSGKVSSKIGPFQASFEGEADVSYDDATKTIKADGKGVDRKGASRGKMVMNCRLEPDGEGTKVIVDTDLQLSGTIAQFGRTGIITEIANVLVADFVRNAEAEMAPAASAPAEAGAQASAPSSVAPPRPAAKPISGFSLLLAALKHWFGRLFSRRAD